MSRMTARHTPLLAALTAAGFIFTLSGCSSQPAVQESPEPAHSVPKAPSKDFTPSRMASAGDGTLDAEADAYAKRLQQALEARNNPNPAAPAEGTAASKSVAAKSGAIEWVDDKYLRTANPPQEKVDAPNTEATKPDAAKPVDEKTTEVTPAKPDVVAVPKTQIKPPSATARAAMEREALLKQIRDRVTSSKDASVDKAMSLAALALVDPSFRLDESELASLPPSQRELVRQFHDLFSSLGSQVASGDAIDRAALGDRLNRIIGEQPLSISTVKLCERVRSFGVYEEMSSETFLAGREHPMVVYVELDHFKSVKSGEHFEVKLSQELVLYNEADGLAVWRQPEQQIVDESRNQRRDFYVVQPTRLPARLGVGKFVLKIRVRDLHGGTRDEVSLPIHVVADPALVKPDLKRFGDGKAG